MKYRELKMKYRELRTILRKLKMRYRELKIILRELKMRYIENYKPRLRDRRKWSRILMRSVRREKGWNSR